MIGDAKITRSLHQCNDSETPYHLPMLGIGLMGGALLVYFGGMHAAELSAAAVLICFSAVISWRFSIGYKSAIDRAVESALVEARSEFERGGSAIALQGLEEVCTEVVPIWARQIETSRSQTETAIMDLSERFAGIVQKLEEAVRTSQNAAGGLSGNGGALAVFGESEKELTAVVDTIKWAQQNRNEMLEKLQGLNLQVVLSDMSLL